MVLIAFLTVVREEPVGNIKKIISSRWIMCSWDPMRIREEKLVPTVHYFHREALISHSGTHQDLCNVSKGGILVVVVPLCLWRKPSLEHSSSTVDLFLECEMMECSET
jgi:hypothetical protein